MAVTPHLSLPGGLSPSPRAGRSRPRTCQGAHHLPSVCWTLSAPLKSCQQAGAMSCVQLWVPDKFHHFVVSSSHLHTYWAWVVEQGSWIKQCLNFFMALSRILSPPSPPPLLCLASFLPTIHTITHSFIHKCSQDLSSGPSPELSDTWDLEMIQTQCQNLGELPVW